jgi:probable selenium-dependent hydroxylase accessory protein YqeC
LIEGGSLVLSPEFGRAKGWIDALGLGPREHVAIVGGGGKTSLCFALANELLGAGKRVITTTTTKVWRKEAECAPCVIFCPSGSPSLDRLKAGIREKGHVFVAQRPLDSGKVEGISPETADALFQDLEIDYVIAEADGAAGRPVKTPAAHEPVIASSATLVIAMMGLESMGMPLDPGVVFRPGLFRDVTGLDKGSTLTPAALARVFQSSQGLFKGSPEPARRIAFLNKSDRLRPDQDADDLARRLLCSACAPIERVVIGSLMKSICRVWIRDDRGMDPNLRIRLKTVSSIPESLDP